MKPAIYNFPDQYKGDTFDQTQFTLKDADTGMGIDITGYQIKIDFRNVLSGPVVAEYTIGNGITIIDAIEGIFRLDEFIVDWSPGKYRYDIEMTLPAGQVKTYLAGSVVIVSDITI